MWRNKDIRIKKSLFCISHLNNKNCTLQCNPTIYKCKRQSVTTYANYMILDYNEWEYINGNIIYVNMEME